jgi:uncharacterized protein YbaP (TraB family)
MQRLVVLLVAFVTACGGSGAQNCTINVPKPADPPPFLWRVTKDNVVVWLYGTIHNGTSGDVPAAAWTALSSSLQFASELGDTEPESDKIAKLMRIESGKTLDFQLSPDDWYELRDILRGTVREDELRHYRPWFAMIRLTQKLSPPPSTTMDKALAERAKKAGKPVDALESWAEQLETLANSVTIKDLRDAIHARKKMKCELSGMLAFYVTGDADAMKKWLAMEASEQLLAARNRKWLAQIEAYFGTGGAFIAVGLGHLIGDGNLPAMLTEKGYTVERVASSRGSN